MTESPRRQRGLGLLELTVFLAVFSALAGALLIHIQRVERDAERTAVDLTVRNINVGIKHAVGDLLMKGQEARAIELLARNPLEFLGGAQGGGAPDLSGWSFDAERRVLSYAPRQPEAFADRHRLDWIVKGRRNDFGRLVDLHLEALDPVR